MATGRPIMIARGNASDIPNLRKPKILIMISIKTGSGILNGTMMIPDTIMIKRIIELDIPRHIKTKKSCLTSLGTGRDIKNERETLTFKLDSCIPEPDPAPDTFQTTDTGIMF
jgi:hypothetical protein